MFPELFLHALTSYFVIIDPVGTALVFHGLTADHDRSYARRMAWRSSLIACGIVLAVAFGHPGRYAPNDDSLSCNGRSENGKEGGINKDTYIC